MKVRELPDCYKGFHRKTYGKTGNGEIAIRLFYTPRQLLLGHFVLARVRPDPSATIFEVSGIGGSLGAAGGRTKLFASAASANWLLARVPLERRIPPL